MEYFWFKLNVFHFWLFKKNLHVFKDFWTLIEIIIKEARKYNSTPEKLNNPNFQANNYNYQVHIQSLASA